MKEFKNPRFFFNPRIFFIVLLCHGENVHKRNRICMGVLLGYTKSISHFTGVFSDK